MFLILLTLFSYTGFEQAHAADQDISSASFSSFRSPKVPVSNITIVNIFPHDPESFTEGLVYHKGFLYESTGLSGKSSLKKIDIRSGKIMKETRLSDAYFGEGIAIIDNKIYQLTWQNQTAIIYDLSSFKVTGKYSYQGEGWGLATDGKILFMSDGSSVISCIDPASFTLTRKIKVYNGNIPVNNLNELEYVKGEIWANIFMEDLIARISPQTGRILGWVDLSRLRSMLPEPEKRDVLNGIAYNPDGDRIYVTGKYWQKLFEIKLQNSKKQ